MGKGLTSQRDIESGIEERTVSKSKMQERNIMNETELIKTILIKNYSLDSAWNLCLFIAFMLIPASNF